MHWLVWLGLAVIVAAVAAVTGIKPRGTRPVASSRLMAVGRVFLVIIAVIFVVMAFSVRTG